MTTPTTITEVATEANALYTALSSDITVDLNFPPITVLDDFAIPDPIGNPAYADITPVTLEELTTQVVGGTGVLDALMTTMNAHLKEQFDKNRITGTEYAKVYLGGMQAITQFAVQFLLGKDRAYWENLQVQAALQLAQAQTVNAQAAVQLTRLQIQMAKYESVSLQLKAYTSRNEYALSKMALVSGYNGILSSEAQILLVNEQVDSQRAQTKDTLDSGLPVLGILGKEKEFKDAQMMTALEQLDGARAQTKETLLDGSPVAGMLSVEKAFKEAQQIEMEYKGQLVLEQVETQRAQTRDTLTTGAAIGGIVAVEKQIKLAQKELTEEQVEVARAQTWDTHLDGTTIVGILAKEKALKDAQSKLVLEQYESQRGQTRGSLTTGETIVGVLGAQTNLYLQQITSYKRDAESKGVKMMLDTWTARKTIDEGVAVPVGIDTAAIDISVANYRTLLGLV